VIDLMQAHRVWPVPARFGTLQPTDWAKGGKRDHPEAWAQARAWLLSFRRYLMASPDTQLRGHGLVLVGETGVGKTMLAATFLNYLQGKGFSVAFVRDGDLMRLLQQQFPNDVDQELLSILQRAACCVLDDLGRTGGSTEVIEPFLRYRMDEAKPTIVTMNNAVPLSATLESLLHEFDYVNMTGVDRRKSPLEVHGARW
jgi:hypothetical protein